LNPASLHLDDFGTDVDLWQAFYPLFCQGAVVDSGSMSGLLQSLIGLLLPSVSPVLQQGFVVPASILWAEPKGADIAHGEQDMGVGVTAAGMVNGPYPRSQIGCAQIPARVRAVGLG
jgi:hypothetical protein